MPSTLGTSPPCSFFAGARGGRPTVIVTRRPRSTIVPGAGFWARTTPLVALGPRSSRTSGARPAAPSARTASTSFLPTSDGTSERGMLDVGVAAGFGGAAGCGVGGGGAGVAGGGVEVGGAGVAVGGALGTARVGVDVGGGGGVADRQAMTTGAGVGWGRDGPVGVP